MKGLGMDGAGMVRDLTFRDLLTAEHAYLDFVNFSLCKKSSLHHNESFYSTHQLYIVLPHT